MCARVKSAGRERKTDSEREGGERGEESCEMWRTASREMIPRGWKSVSERERERRRARWEKERGKEGAGRGSIARRVV